MSRAVVLMDRERALTPRGAAIRNRLLELATAMISRDGYSATTIQKLADESKLGRGSLLHQFPTRHDLIMEVTRSIGAWLNENSQRHFAQLKDPWERLNSYSDLIWSNANSVPGMALAEIAFAARWEPGLYDRVHPHIDALLASFYGQLRQTGKDAGIKDLVGLDARIQLLTVAAHGLVLDRHLHRRTALVQAALQTMKDDYCRSLTELGVPSRRLQSTRRGKA